MVSGEKLKELLFPYKEVRKIQDELIEEVDKCIKLKKNLIIHAPTGLGKCVGENTLIFTEKGLQKISDLYLKNVDINSLSKDLKTVVKEGRVIRKKRSQMYTATTKIGRTIDVTDDHKFLTIKNNKLLWKELKNLQKGDYIACSRRLFLKERNPVFTVAMVSNLDKRWLSKLTIDTEPSIEKIVENIKNKNNLTYKELAKEVNCTVDSIRETKRRNKIMRLDYALNLLRKASLDFRSIKLKRVGMIGRVPIQVPKDRKSVV